MTATEREPPPPPYIPHSTSETISVSLVADPESRTALVSLIPPKEPATGRRAPVDICCVIDVSGSMDEYATMPAQSTGAAVEVTGLTVLDVVKHAMKTIISTMKEDDRIAVVTFSDAAKVITNLTRTTPTGKTAVIQLVDGLRTEGMTNLWDGLKCGMKLLNSSASEQAPTATTESLNSLRLSSLFLLTDGQPNVNPPRGHIPMLKAFLDANPSHFGIHTFGFGYSLDSQLLTQIAEMGGGGYGFIPDSGMVGTVFVHAIANAYSTFATKTQLDIELPEGFPDISTVPGGLPLVKTSWGIQIDTGDIQYGQTKDIILALGVLPTDDKTSITATIRYRPWTLDRAAPLMTSSATLGVTPSIDTPTRENIKYHTYRLTFVDNIRNLLGKRHKDMPANAKKAPFESIITAIAAETPNCISAVAFSEDLSGQVLIALSDSKQFTRWGQHYLPSLARSHLRQQCSNFKDKGLEVYGRDSPLFIKSRDEIDAAFDDIPPPKPSRGPPPPNTFAPSSGGSAPRRSVPITSMAYYNSRSNPCFSGDCSVLTNTGSHSTSVKVEALRRGMSVLTANGPRKVAAVLRTAIVDGEAYLCQVGQLKITPWHPIVSPFKENVVWTFPHTISEIELIPCNAIYSILLEPGSSPDAHTVYVSGVLCATLGHGLTDITSTTSDVRGHNFFGDYERVLQSIRQLEGFDSDEGVVHCIGIQRDSNGLVCGFKQLPETPLTDLSQTLTSPIVV